MHPFYILTDSLRTIRLKRKQQITTWDQATAHLEGIPYAFSPPKNFWPPPPQMGDMNFQKMTPPKVAKIEKKFF